MKFRWHMCATNSKKVNNNCYMGKKVLTHWGRVAHICVSKLSLVQIMACRMAAASDSLLSIGTSRINNREIVIEFQTFSFKKMHLKISSAKWRLSCLGLNVLENDTIRCEWNPRATFSDLKDMFVLKYTRLQQLLRNNISLASSTPYQ